MTTRKANDPPLTEAEGARIQAQIAQDSDSPEITDEQAALLRPFSEAFPGLHAAWKRRPGRPKAEVTKVPVKLRLDPDVVEGYRATGPGWQTRMNDVLREGMSTGRTTETSKGSGLGTTRHSASERLLDTAEDRPRRGRPKAESA